MTYINKRYLITIRILIVLIVLMFFFSNNMCAYADESGYCGADVIWNYNSSTKTLTISGSGKMKDYNGVQLSPWVNRKLDIEHVVIEEGITHIGDSSFYKATGIQDVSFPSTLVSIGSSAFSKTSMSGVNIVLPDSVNEIGSYAFSSSGIVSINLPQGITTIETGVFKNCASLKSIDFPQNLATIGSYAFWGCTSLESIIIPNSVTEIGDYAFTGCTNVTNIVLSNQLQSIPYLCFSSTSITSITIPDSITEIGKESFNGCKNLTDIYFGSGLVNIRRGAFCQAAFTDITIPEGVKVIEDDVFCGCTKLKTVTLPSTLEEYGEVFSDISGPVSSIITYTPCNTAATKMSYLYKTVYSHDMETIDYLAPTCTQPGHKTYYYCTRCKDYYFNYEGTTSIKDYEMKTLTIPQTGHNPVKDCAVEPTLYSTGLTEGSHCDNCGMIFKKQEIIPKLEQNDQHEDSQKNNSNEDNQNNNQITNGQGNQYNTTENSSNDSTSNNVSSPGGNEDSVGTNNSQQLSNEWFDGKWYNADGSQVYSGTLMWKSNSTGWWVEDTSGWYPVSCWQKIDGVWYYFGDSGYMATNEYVDGYWLNSDGSCSNDYFLTWKSNSTGWWVEDKSGWWPSSKWLKINGSWYYFNSSGYMVTNQYVDGYWIGSDGVCN